jgi:tRNA modification GTPase
MMNINLDDTIAAVATPIGESGIGIVRISGNKALSIADKVFISNDCQKPSSFKTYTTHYGWIVDRGQRTELRGQKGLPSDKVVDEVILTVMRKPRSYTRQNIVEINCHGGIIPLRKTLELVLDSGARLAKPGEFTQRAFLNGRIDLSQAEAVLDIIRAKTDYALKLSLEQLKGGLSKELSRLRNRLLDSLAILEANIDFPEEDLETVDIKSIASNLAHINKELESLLENSKTGRVFREGVKIVICGKPNVGKSSLLNSLLKCERSIVTHVAGTTRDTIEEILDINGIPIRIVDTAGIIEPRDLIEKKAVSRSQRCIREADLVLFVFDGSKDLSYEDEILMRKVKPRPSLALINKIDLRQKIKRQQITPRFQQIVEVSAKTQKNIDLLKEAIAQFVFNGKIKSSQPLWITNIRHIQQLEKAQKIIRQIQKSTKMNIPFEFIAYQLKQAIGCLDEILGRHFSEDLLDRIFSEFCIGK